MALFPGARLVDFTRVIFQIFGWLTKSHSTQPAMELGTDLIREVRKESNDVIQGSLELLFGLTQPTFLEHCMHESDLMIFRQHEL